MANDNKLNSSLDGGSKDEGLEPATAPDPVNEVAIDERAQDFGESGQHAPGGYYNQQNVLAPDRIDLDEQVKSALESEKDK
jgi:hypothetical protein